MPNVGTASDYIGDSRSESVCEWSADWTLECLLMTLVARRRVLKHGWAVVMGTQRSEMATKQHQLTASCHPSTRTCHHGQPWPRRAATRSIRCAAAHTQTRPTPQILGSFFSISSESLWPLCQLENRKGESYLAVVVVMRPARLTRLRHLHMLKQHQAKDL